MNSFLRWAPVAMVLICAPIAAHASIESSMEALQTKLVGTILPLMSILGLLFAGLAYLAGSPNAKGYLWASIIGAGVGFGAESIVGFIRGVVH